MYLSTNQIPKFSYFIIGLYCLFGLVYWTIFLEQGTGDEGLMAYYLNESQEKGFYWLIQSGNFSIPHAILVFPLSLVFSNYFSLRLLSFFGVLFIFFYSMKKIQHKTALLNLHLLFYLFSGSFLLGTNDTLFYCFFIVFILEVFLKFSDQSSKIPGYAWFCLVSAFFTRQMAVVYLPFVLGILFLLFRDRKFGLKETGMICGSICFWVILNIPSLLQNGSLGFDNKTRDTQQGTTWSQRQYLSQVYANEGKIPEFTHVTWEETRAYLDEHGEESLPSSTFKSLIFDLSFTIKEFWKDLFFLVQSGLRQAGLSVTFPLAGLLLTANLKNSKLKIFAIGQGIQMLIFATIIISYVEIRWLAPVMMIGIWGINDLIMNHKSGLKFFNLNLAVLTLLSFYGIFKYSIMIMQTSIWSSLMLR